MGKYIILLNRIKTQKCKESYGGKLGLGAWTGWSHLGHKAFVRCF